MQQKVVCTKEKQVLIIIDNHDSHCSLEAIDFARDNGIVMLTIPPHTSHRLQTLDVTVFGPFKAAYYQAMDDWLRTNPGRTVTIYEIASLVCTAHMKRMIPANAIAGFRATGTYPFNRQVFSEEDFMPAETTNQPMPS